MGATDFMLGGRIFATKTAATEAVRQILHGTRAGSTVCMKDELLLRDLLELHPDSVAKIGCGVSRFEVRTNRVNGGAHPGFWVIRTDGTETDFSYKNCLNGKKPEPREEFIRACRAAILPHINNERTRFFNEAQTPTCALTGVSISPNTAHVDHCPPLTFASIVDGFIALYKLDVNNVSLVDGDGDGKIVPTLASPVMRDRFIQFHNNFAKLRVISRDANLTLVPKMAMQAALL